MAHTATAPRFHGRTKDRGDDRVMVDEPVQRRSYGGFHFGAAFFGWVVSIGISVIISLLLTGIGTAIVNGTVTSEGLANSAGTIGVVSGILLLITLAIAYYTGGYVAGRMSRFDGARQGVGVWAIGLIVSILLSIVGSLFAAANIDTWARQFNLQNLAVDEGSILSGGVLMLVLSLTVTLLAAIIGGKVGEEYHRKIDRAGAVEVEAKL